MQPLPLRLPLKLKESGCTDNQVTGHEFLRRTGLLDECPQPGRCIRFGWQVCQRHLAHFFSAVFRPFPRRSFALSGFLAPRRRERAKNGVKWAKFGGETAEKQRWVTWRWTQIDMFAGFSGATPNLWAMAGYDGMFLRWEGTDAQNKTFMANHGYEWIWVNRLHASFLTAASFLRVFSFCASFLRS